ncbi:MAG: WXG100 family type VII secretion target [Nitrososphaerales archaeon]|jgi:WXG100 family type VII secretion target
MAQIVVTADELDNVASQLTNGAADVLQQFNTLKAAVENLVSGGWQGTASQSYQETYTQWNQGAQQVHQALEQISQMLRGAATTYRDTEASLTSQLKG